MSNLPHVNSYINGILRAYAKLNETGSDLPDGILCPTREGSLEEQFRSIQSSNATRNENVKFDSIQRPWTEMRDCLQAWMFRFAGCIRTPGGQIQLTNHDSVMAEKLSLDFQVKQAAYVVSLIEELHCPKVVSTISWETVYRDSGKPAYRDEDYGGAFLIETDSDNQVLFLNSTLL